MAFNQSSRHYPFSSPPPSAVLPSHRSSPSHQKATLSTPQVSTSPVITPSSQPIPNHMVSSSSSSSSSMNLLSESQPNSFGMTIPSNNSQLPPFKVLIIGDPASGKSCLLQTFLSGRFPEQHIPVFFSSELKQVKEHTLEISDVDGEVNSGALRGLMFPTADIFLLCCSVMDELAFAHLTDRWMSEILKYRNKSSILVLVGTKTDLRKELKIKSISSDELRMKASQIGADWSAECSAFANHQVSEVFEGALRCLLVKKAALALDKKEQDASLPPPIEHEVVKQQPSCSSSEQPSSSIHDPQVSILIQQIATMQEQISHLTQRVKILEGQPGFPTDLNLTGITYSFARK